MSGQPRADRDLRGPRGPRVVSRPAPAWARLLTLAAVVAASGARAQPGPAAPPATRDSAQARVVFWPEVTTLVEAGRVRDVAFLNSGLNIVSAVEMAWCADAQSRTLVAVATKPIAGTAEAGEEMGRRAEGALVDPAAIYASAAGVLVLGQDARLLAFRSGWTDTLDLGPANGPARDLAVGPSGLVYILLGNEVRVFSDPPRGKPLWTIPAPASLGSVVGMAASARGDIYLAGDRALAILELDAKGAWKPTRSRTLSELGVGSIGGLALTPALLVPLERREGWSGRDRFLLLSDPGKPAVLALEAATLETVGRIDLAAELPGAVPGRLDISNRAQIAIVDPESGRALALPARLFARLIEGAKIRWRTIEPDSTAAGSSGS